MRPLSSATLVAPAPAAPASAAPAPAAPAPAAPRVPAVARAAWQVLFLLALVAPLTLTDLPPLLDYPNHLARMFVLGAHGHAPAIDAIYDVRWRAIPNVGMDAVVPLLARFVPLDVAGRVFVAAAILLPVLGTVALHRAAFGVRALWPWASGLVAYNGLLMAGFLNFLVGAGLALLGAAAWLSLRGHAWRVPAACAASAAIFFCHLIAWAFFALLIAALALAEARGRARAGSLAIAAVPFLAPLALLALQATALPADGAAGAEGTFPARYMAALAQEGVARKALNAVASMVTYAWHLDIIGVALLLAVPFVAARRRMVPVAPALVAVFAALCAAFPLVPNVFFGTGFLDTRLPPLALLVLIAGTDPGRVAGRLPVVRLLLGAVLLARVGVVGAVWAGHGTDVADLRRMIAPVPPGARVIAVTAGHDKARGAEPRSRTIMVALDATMHMPALLVIDRQAFWPLLFSVAAKQPIRVRPPYDRIALGEGWLVSWRELDRPTPDGLRAAPYLADWRRDFDFVLVMNAGRLPDGLDAPAHDLDRLGQADIASLYRIRHAD